MLTTLLQTRAHHRRTATAVAGMLVWTPLAWGVVLDQDPPTISVPPGSSWSRSGDVPPGTVLELVGPGVHIPAVLEGLRGTPEAPIVVRRTSSGQTAPFIVGGESGLVVRNCEHLLIEEVALIGATRRGILIESSRSISIRNVLVARTGPEPDADGIEIVDSSKVELRTIRFDGWQDAALDLRDATDVRGSDLQFTRLVRHLTRTAVRVGEGCRDVGLEEFTTRSIPVALEIGDSNGRDPLQATDEPAGRSERSPRDITLESARLDRPEVAIRLGDAKGVDLRRLTIVDPRIVFEIEAEALEDARFSENVVVWAPGALTAFARVACGDGGLELGSNLWWSAELPAALPILGALPGHSAAPQRFSPDPALDPRGHPTHPEAEGLGRPAPTAP